jgi:NADPH:quinone reductase-like Zn-dependent oxidoreductase
VEPNGAQLSALPELKPQIDSVFPLDQFKAAFARTAEHGKNGKVVLRVS